MRKINTIPLSKERFVITMSNSAVSSDTKNAAKKIQDNDLDGVNIFVDTAHQGGINVFVGNYKSNLIKGVILAVCAVISIGLLILLKQKHCKKIES